MTNRSLLDFSDEEDDRYGESQVEIELLLNKITKETLTKISLPALLNLISEITLGEIYTLVNVEDFHILPKIEQKFLIPKPYWELNPYFLNDNGDRHLSLPIYKSFYKLELEKLYLIISIEKNAKNCWVCTKKATNIPDYLVRTVYLPYLNKIFQSKKALSGFRVINYGTKDKKITIDDENIRFVIETNPKCFQISPHSVPLSPLEMFNVNSGNVQEKVVEQNIMLKEYSNLLERIKEIIPELESLNFKTFETVIIEQYNKL